MGNLQNFIYPNGVTHAYTYDPLNRLTQMGASKSQSAISNYAYTLGAAGNRTSVAELTGRTVAYVYDSLYRLTSETVSADPHSNNGAGSYTYDNVGNRKTLSSTLPPQGGTTYTYDADDRLASDSYDPDGNTINSGGIANGYDFENHLITHGGVTVAYDGDGNRVGETVSGVTTNYLVDTQNPTGYGQVVDELQNGAVTRTYAYGLERISENQTISSTWTPSFYGYDGHGSVRQLTNSAGIFTDTYDYDAFGNLINQAGSTPNVYLFAGEQYDLALGLYYNRARYYSTASGRFWNIDTNEGDLRSPLSLHKYLYASSDPVNRLDPSGHDDIAEMTASFAINNTLNALSVLQLPGGGPDNFISSMFATLIPDSVFSDLLSLTPDAAEVGLSVAGTIGRGYGSIGGGGGAEFLVSPKTGQWAGYTYFGGVASLGASPTSLGVGITGGLVYRCHYSTDYEGQFITVSVPFSWLREKWPAVASKIVGDAATAAAPPGIGGSLPPEVTSTLAALSSAFSQLLSKNGSINFFVGPTQPHSFGISIGVGGGASFNGSSSKPSLGWSYYFQDLPKFDYPYDFRE